MNIRITGFIPDSWHKKSAGIFRHSVFLLNMKIPDSFYQFIRNLTQLLGTYIYLLERSQNFLCSIVGFFRAFHIFFRNSGQFPNCLNDFISGIFRRLVLALICLMLCMELLISPSTSFTIFLRFCHALTLAGNNLLHTLHTFHSKGRIPDQRWRYLSISWLDWSDCSASFLIWPATTANPRPLSPARAASMEHSGSADWFPLQ